MSQHDTVHTVECDNVDRVVKYCEAKGFDYERKGTRWVTVYCNLDQFRKLLDTLGFPPRNTSERKFMQNGYK
jgi:hypothetical protein